MHTIDFREKIEDKGQAAFVILYALDGQPWKDYAEDKYGRRELIIPTALCNNRSDGSIGFIGGKVESGESLEEAAIREVEEEIGLTSDQVEVAGFLDSHVTANTGFVILPVVGFVSPDYRLAIDPGEVAEVFEAPLAYILDPQNQARRSLERGGVRREFYAIDYQGHTIWGATAAMIVNLSERLGFR